MKKIVIKTILFAMGLSIVPLQADAQFFKKLFKKKSKTEQVVKEKKKYVEQTVMVNPDSLEDNSNNRNGFLGIPLGIDADDFDKQLKNLGFTAYEQAEKQTAKTYKYDGEVMGEKSVVTLITSEKTNTVYAVDVAEPKVYPSDAAISKRNVKLRKELVALYGKGYVNKSGECYTIVTPLGTVNLHYERITIGGGYTIGFSVDDAKAYKQAYDEMVEKEYEPLPRTIEKGTATVVGHSDVVGVGVGIMEARTLAKARALLAKYDYAVGKTTSRGVVSTLTLAAGYKSTVDLRRRGSSVNYVTITATEDKEQLAKDLQQAGFEADGKNAYKNGRVRLAWTQDKQGRQVLKFTAKAR